MWGLTCYICGNENVIIRFSRRIGFCSNECESVFHKKDRKEKRRGKIACYDCLDYYRNDIDWDYGEPACYICGCSPDHWIFWYQFPCGINFCSKKCEKEFLNDTKRREQWKRILEQAGATCQSCWNYQE